MRSFDRHSIALIAGLIAGMALLISAPVETAATRQQIQAATEHLAKPWSGDLDGMIKRRVIRVATAYNKTFYFIDRGVQRGAVYEAYKLFEEDLNATLKTKHLRVNVVFIPVSRDDLLKSVAEGRADIAAAGLTITPERQKIVDFTPASLNGVDELVVTGPGGPAISISSISC